jgi:hypothetical protein
MEKCIVYISTVTYCDFNVRKRSIKIEKKKKNASELDENTCTGYNLLWAKQAVGNYSRKFVESIPWLEEVG